MAEPCITYCTHGGVCELDAGHEGLHDSGYCQWSDAEAIAAPLANRRLAEKGPMGEMIAGLWGLVVDDDGV